MMIGYDIYDRFTLCQSMILTTSFFCSRQYMFFTNKINFGNLGNYVTVGDTFISKLIFKVKF
jgi:hypothetical protein